MNLSKFERFDNNGLELVVNTDTGLAYASKKAAARMLGVTKETVGSQAFKLGGEDYDVVGAKINTPGGLQEARLVSASIIFKLAVKYNPDLAIKMGEAGANQYMLNLAGYKLKPVEQTPPRLPQTKLEWMLEAVEAEKRLIAAEEAKQALEAQIEADKGKVLLGGAIEAAEGGGVNITLSKFAQVIGVGRNTLFRILREIKIIQQNYALPYQWMINKGYASVTEKVSYNKNGSRIDAVTLITPKGQMYLMKRLEELKRKEQVEVVMEGVLVDVSGC
jgi:phage antirepressor YoqD-like protein